MHVSDPDFEAMKEITRLSWLLDVNPVSAPTGREPATAGDAPRRERA